MPTLLFVDDNQVLVRFTTRILESSIPNLKVLSCHSCAQARDLVTHFQPELLILDRNLPDGDGQELIKELSGLLRQPKAIMLTAASLGNDKPNNHPEKALAVLKKPFEADELVSVVKQALGLESNVERSDPPTDPAMRKPTNPKAFTLDRHLMINRLSGLMAGLRAFGADLRAEAHDPQAVLRLVDEHEDRLVRVIRKMSDLITKCPNQEPGLHETGKEKGIAR